MSNAKYIEAIGRRKTSTARVRLTESAKADFKINDKTVAEYFPTREMQVVVAEALPKSGLVGIYSISPCKWWWYTFTSRSCSSWTCSCHSKERRGPAFCSKENRIPKKRSES
jgi:hypothetical protein